MVAYAPACKLRLMTYAGASRSTSARWRWAAAIVFSLAANSLVAFLFWELRVAPVYDSAPATIVRLMPRLTLPRYRSEAPRHPPARSAPLAVRASPAPAAIPSAPASVAASAPSVAPPDRADAANLSGALRGLFGCGLPHPTDADRAACAEKLAANLPTLHPPFNLDPHGRYVSDPEPYLTRKPKNGCKVMASGDSVVGQHGVAAGVGCAKSF